MNQYLVVQYLGRGTSGKVFLCMDILDKRLYAVKIVRKTPREIGKPPTPLQLSLPQRKVELEEVEKRGAATVGEGEARSSESEKKADVENATASAAVSASAAPTATTTTTTTTTTSEQQPSLKRPPLKKKVHDPLADLRREIEILRDTGGHPNIVSLREVVDDPTSNKMLIVMEYCEGGPVMTRAGLARGRRIPEEVSRPYFRDMVAALGYLHRLRIIHGDLKPENALMCASGRVMLSDFGCSKILPKESDDVDRCNGTPAFLAPEMMVSGASFRGWPTDVYALGACLFTFIFGKIPFTAATVSELFKIVKSEPLCFPEVPQVSAEVKDILEGLLCKDPEQRLTLEQAANHAWTTDNGRLPPVSLGNDSSSSSSLETAFSSSATNNANAKTATTQDSPFHLHRSSDKKESAEEESAKEESAKEEGCGESSSEGGVDPHVADGDAAVAALLHHQDADLQVKTFGAGQVLMRQGDRAHSLYYILEGELEVLYTPMEGAVHRSTSSTLLNNTTTTTTTTTATMNTAADANNSSSSSSSSSSTAAAMTPTTPATIGVGAAADASAAVSGEAIKKLWSPSMKRGSLRGGSAASSSSQLGSFGSLGLGMLARAGTSSDTTPRTLPSLSLSAAAAQRSSPPSPAAAAVSSPAPQQQQLKVDADVADANVDVVVVVEKSGDSSSTFAPPPPPVPFSSTAAAAADDDINDDENDNFTAATVAAPVDAPDEESSSEVTETSTAAAVDSKLENENSTTQLSSVSAASVSAASPPPAQPEEEASGHIPWSITPAATTSLPSAHIETAGGGADDDDQTDTTAIAAAVLETPRDNTPHPTAAAATDDCTRNGASETFVEKEEERNEALTSITTTTTASQSPTRVVQPSKPSKSTTTMDALQLLLPEPKFRTSPLKSSSRSLGPSPMIPTIEEEHLALPYLDILTRPASAASWAPQAQLSRAFSARSETLLDGSSMSLSGIGNLSDDDDDDIGDIGDVVDGLSSSTLSTRSSLHEDDSDDDIDRPMALAAAAVDASEFVETLNRGNGEYLLAVRGPGDFIGETALIGGSDLRRSSSVRAASKTVRVVCIPYSVAKDHFKSHPLSKQRLAELVWARQSETIVIEALLRMDGISGELSERAWGVVEDGW